jgi:Fe-S oxidoreductase
MISKGMLRQAKALAQKQFECLMPFITREMPILFLEPSCLSAAVDDYKGLIGQKVNGCESFDAFLEKHLRNGQLPLSIHPKKRRIKLHGHCHQKAMGGTKPTLQVLKAIPDCDVEEISSGCCGMAGSFGYEKEHYAFSMKMGELKLLPAVRSASQETIIVANGFSCRAQIAHGTTRTALHLAEVLANMI